MQVVKAGGLQNRPEWFVGSNPTWPAKLKMHLLIGVTSRFQPDNAQAWLRVRIPTGVQLEV